MFTSVPCPPEMSSKVFTYLLFKEKLFFPKMLSPIYIYIYIFVYKCLALAEMCIPCPLNECVG